MVTKNFVADIIEDKKGKIWICSDNGNGRGWGVSYYSAESSFNKRTTLSESDNYAKPILSILEDADGNIWFGAFGVYRYDGSAITYFTPY